MVQFFFKKNNYFLILDSAKLVGLYCPKCKMAFNKVFGQKETHCKKCSTLFLYQCKVCNKLYRTYGIAQNHMKFKCQNPRLFFCNKCSYSSTYKANVKMHMESRHFKQEPGFTPTCTKCNKIFKTLTILKKHAKICGAINTA